MEKETPVHFMATLTEQESPMFTSSILLPARVAEQFRTPKGAIRVLCSIEQAEEFPCALNPRGNDYIIIVSKALIKKHKLMYGNPFKVAIRPDPENGLLLPEELQEVLAQDDWGSSLFNTLLPGRQRGYIHYVRSAKTVDTRIKRALEIVEKLKRTPRNPS